LPDVKPFFGADVLVVFHRCNSSDDMDWFSPSSYPIRAREIALII